MLVFQPAISVGDVDDRPICIGSGLYDINIRVAISNRETRQKRQRQVIESDFGCEVFDR